MASSIATDHPDASSASLVKAPRFGVGRFAANCANTASVCLIRQGLARSAIDYASAFFSHGTVKLFANGGDGLSLPAAAVALRHTSGGAISSISKVNW
jgi:hypothetical protein